MRSAPSILPVKNPLMDAVRKAEAGDFSLLQGIVKKDDIEKLPWHRASELDLKTPFVIFLSAINNALSSHNKSRITVALQLLEAVIAKNILKNVLMTAELTKLISTLQSKLCVEQYIKTYAALTAKLAESASTWVWRAELRFSDSIKEEKKHEKFSSLTKAPVKQKMPDVSKENPVESALRKLPLLEAGILKFEDQDTFNKLLTAIAVWDAHSVYHFTYHPSDSPAEPATGKPAVPGKKIPDNYYGLESWLLLSLLHARTDKEKFNNVLCNIIHLRDALYAQKKYNAVFKIFTILESSILSHMIDKDSIGQDNFSGFQETLAKDKVNFFRSRELLARLQQKDMANSEPTFPIESLNGLLALAEEVGTSEYNAPIASMKQRLKGSAGAMATNSFARALKAMHRVTLEQLETQIDPTTKFDEKGKKYRTWLPGPAYIETFPATAVAVIPTQTSSPELSAEEKEKSDSSEEAAPQVPAALVAQVPSLEISRSHVAQLRTLHLKKMEEQQPQSPRPQLQVSQVKATKWQPSARPAEAGQPKKKVQIAGPRT